MLKGTGTVPGHEEKKKRALSLLIPVILASALTDRGATLTVSATERTAEQPPAKQQVNQPKNSIPKSEPSQPTRSKKAASPEPKRGLYKWKDAEPRDGQQAPVTTPAPQQNITRTKSKKNSQESQRCKRVKEQISAIDARMRAGYRDSEYLRDRRRQLVDERSKACH